MKKERLAEIVRERGEARIIRVEKRGKPARGRVHMNR